MDIHAPICDLCDHRQGDRKCAAFPGGIPDAIWWSEKDHRLPYRGDHGIQFANASVPKAAFDDLWGPPGSIGAEDEE